MQTIKHLELCNAAWKATRMPFVVADLETTGLRPSQDEILEFAAVHVDPVGAIESEFSMLVRSSRSIPNFITQLTGITQDEVDREGRPLVVATMKFLAFIGSCPVFFHNASFDESFIKQNVERTGQRFINPVHDTLQIARFVWPKRKTYKLDALAELVGVPAPPHRALADAKAALSVLLAARTKAKVCNIDGYYD